MSLSLSAKWKMIGCRCSHRYRCCICYKGPWQPDNSPESFRGGQPRQPIQLLWFWPLTFEFLSMYLWTDGAIPLQRCFKLCQQTDFQKSYECHQAMVKLSIVPVNQSSCTMGIPNIHFFWTHHQLQSSLPWMSERTAFVYARYRNAGEKFFRANHWFYP